VAAVAEHDQVVAALFGDARDQLGSMAGPMSTSISMPAFSPSSRACAASPRKKLSFSRLTSSTSPTVAA
jgi:hypothetical protein